MSKTAHELTRKEMKGPDRFQVAASEAAEWASKRQKQLVLAGVFDMWPLDRERGGFPRKTGPI